MSEPADVSLIVYDLLGREVATLASGHHTAGYHSATWSARLRPSGFGGQAGDFASGGSSKGGYASGVYFARFTATSLAGELKLAKVSKLILTKQS